MAAPFSRLIQGVLGSLRPSVRLLKDFCLDATEKHFGHSRGRVLRDVVPLHLHRRLLDRAMARRPGMPSSANLTLLDLAFGQFRPEVSISPLTLGRDGVSRASYKVNHFYDVAVPFPEPGVPPLAILG